ncbi:hypothetical protein ACMFMG_002375 [Clarireedia jacksonii]
MQPQVARLKSGNLPLPQYNGQRITVSLFASSPCQANGNLQHETYIEDRLIGLLNQAVTADGKGYDELVDEVSDIILDLGKPPFSRVALLLPHSVLSDQGLHSEVIIHRAFVSGNRTVNKVQVGSHTMLCKAHRAGLQDSKLKQELVSAQKIREAFTDARAHIRVPSLQGYVRYANSGAIVGLLREFILSGIYGGTLRDVNVSTVRKEMRWKWENQISKTVDELYEAGVVGGDGKASNVLIDQSDNAWLINFVSEWSKGWVDEELTGSR